MLGDLVDSTRELRRPFVVGWSVIFALWLLVGHFHPVRFETGGLAHRLAVELDKLGSGSRLAALAFVATMLGSVLNNLGVNRLVGAIFYRVSGRFDWQGFIEQAQDDLRRYEEHSVTFSSSDKVVPTSGSTFPSPGFSELTYRASVDSRERRRSEMEFRVLLAVSGVIPAVAVIVVGGWTWSWVCGVLAVLWLDVLAMRFSTERYVHLATVRKAEADLRQAVRNRDSKVSLRETRVAEVDQMKANGKPDQVVARAEARIPTIEQLAATDEKIADLERLLVDLDAFGNRRTLRILGDATVYPERFEIDHFGRRSRSVG